MCLGIPGQVVEIQETPTGVTMGKVNFDGIVKDVCLSPLPDVKIGDYIMVHFGLATSKLEEDEAQGILKFLREFDDFEYQENAT